MITEKTSRKINTLSFILFIGVMLIHTYNLQVYSLTESGNLVVMLENYLNRLTNGVCVPYFFMISGYLFFRNFELSKTLKKYRTRIRSILIPYIVWNTIYYIFFAVIKRIPAILAVMNSRDSVELSLAGYLKFVWDGYYTLWFLRVLMWMILCSPVWYIVLKHRKYYWAEIVLVLFLVLSIKGDIIPSNMANVYYLIGAYLGINHSNIVNWDNEKASIAGCVIFGVIAALGGIFAGNILYNLAFIASSWLALNIFSYRKSVAWWGRCTFFYYCAHDMILETIEKVFLIVFGVGTAQALADYIFAPVLTLCILIVTAMLLRKVTKPLWTILNGGR